MQILLVEDNETLAKGLIYSLEQNKYNVIHKMNVKETSNYLENNKPDLIILDVSLPDGDGFRLYSNLIKKKKIATIFLTAKDEEDDVVKGLELGADDYIIKPFRNRELISRIKSVLRRYYHDEINENQIKCRDVIIDSNKAVVYKAGKEIIFTSLEYKILYMLISNKNILVTREQILDKIWDVAGNFVNDNTLTVYIKRIRNKLDDKEGKFIQTVRGIGYKVVE